MERNVMGELNVYRGSGAKPNFSEIARRHGMDRHTVAKYWREGESAADGRSARGSAFDPLEEVIRAKAQLPGMTRRGRPAQLPRDLPARGPALQHPLDRVPLVPGEPAVGPRGRLLGSLFLLSGHAVLRSPGAGRSGPQGIGFPHSSAHVRMNVGGVRIKSIIKAPVWWFSSLSSIYAPAKKSAILFPAVPIV